MILYYVRSVIAISPAPAAHHVGHKFRACFQHALHAHKLKSLRRCRLDLCSCCKRCSALQGCGQQCRVLQASYAVVSSSRFCKKSKDADGSQQRSRVQSCHRGESKVVFQRPTGLGLAACIHCRMQHCQMRLQLPACVPFGNSKRDWCVHALLHTRCPASNSCAASAHCGSVCRVAQSAALQRAVTSMHAFTCHSCASVARGLCSPEVVVALCVTLLWPPHSCWHA